MAEKKKTIDEIVKADKGGNKRDPLSEFVYDIENEVVEFISTNSISINLLYSGKVNGGIPIGHVSMISADSMLGKSFIANQIIRNAQKKKMQVVVLDT